MPYSPIMFDYSAKAKLSNRLVEIRLSIIVFEVLYSIILSDFAQ